MHWGNHSNYDAFLSAIRSDGLGDLGSLEGSKSKKIFSSTIAAWEAVKSLRPTVVKQAQQVLAKIDQVSSVASQARSAIDQASAETSSGDFFSVGSGVDTSAIDDAEAQAVELSDKMRSIIDDVQSGAMSHQTGSTVPEQAQLDAAAGITPDWAGWAGTLAQYQTDISAVNGKLTNLVRAIQQNVQMAQRAAQQAVKKRQAEEARARAAELAQQRAQEAADRAEALRQQRQLQAEQRQIDAQMRQEQAQRDAEARREQQQIAADQARQQAELQREAQRVAMENQLAQQQAALEAQRNAALYQPIEAAATPVAVAPAPVVSPFPDVNYADPSVVAQNLPPPTVAAQPYVQQQAPVADDWFYGSMQAGNEQLFGVKGLGNMGETQYSSADIPTAPKDRTIYSSPTASSARGSNLSPGWSASAFQGGSNTQSVVDKLLSEGNIDAAKNLINAFRPGTIPVAPPPEPKSEVPWGAIALGVAGVAVATKLLKVW